MSIEEKKKWKNTNGNHLKSAIDLNSNLLFENGIAAESAPLENLKWMKTSEAAQYLRVSIGSIKNMVYRRQLLPRKLGRLNRFLREDLDRVIDLPLRKKGEI